MIAVENLVKHYAAFPALKGITFEVARGEVVGFLGPNGAGKTTTLRILTGYMPATRGSVRVAGLDVARQSTAVRRRVGYLPEDVPLYRDLTVLGFLRYMGGLKEVPARRLTAEIERVIALAGLEPVQSRLLSKCSKGFRQRTGIALALLGDPPVLILDEPTSGLDPNQVIEVRELIRKLSGEKTVLLSSHILSEVAQICTRVLIIHEGALVAEGDATELSRRYGGTERLYLATEGLPEGALRSCPGILEIAPAGDGAWLLTVDDARAAAPGVAQAVIEAGGRLVELRREAASLEAVFRAVTGMPADA